MILVTDIRAPVNSD